MDSSRKQEVQVMDRVLLNLWFHKMNMHPDGLAEECNDPDTIEHLILECLQTNSRTIGYKGQ